jgi:hypothetical protein
LDGKRKNGKKKRNMQRKTMGNYVGEMWTAVFLIFLFIPFFDLPPIHSTGLAEEEEEDGGIRISFTTMLVGKSTFWDLEEERWTAMSLWGTMDL